LDVVTHELFGLQRVAEAVQARDFAGECRHTKAPVRAAFCTADRGTRLMILPETPLPASRG